MSVKIQNTMKRIFSYFIAALCLMACHEIYDPSLGDPGKLTNISFSPLPGAGYIHYTIPDNPGFVYAKAVYTLDNGSVISKTSSRFVDSIYVDGFLDEKEYEISMYAVNDNDEEVLSEVIKVTPYKSSIYDVAESIVLGSGVASAYITVQNPDRQRTTVYLTLDDGISEVSSAFVSEASEETFLVSPLEMKEYKVSVYTSDSYGNQSTVRDLGSIMPQEDQEINKKRWKLLQDQYVPDELIESSNYQYPKNAAMAYWDGEIESLWDGVIDRGDNTSYFNAGCNPPFSYYIDLGRSVQISRVVTWQRRNNVDVYSDWQIQEYELYGSNETDENGVVINWFKLNTFRIIKPDTEAQAQKEVEDGHMFYVNSDTYGFSEPLRYLRMRVTSMFGAGVGQCFCSELTLYGLDSEETL